MSVPLAPTMSLDSTPHVDAGDLVRLHDGELSPAAASRVTAHLARCAACTARSDTLRGLTAHLHDALRAAAPDDATRDSSLPAALARPPWRLQAAARLPDRARHRGRSAVAVAAALALLTAAAAASPSVRAAVTGWVRPLVGRPREVPATLRAGGEPARASGPAAADAGELAFAPSGDTVRISVRGEAGDSLLVRTAASGAVRVRFRTTGAAPTLVTLPERLRLTSAPGSATIYRIDVPRQVRVLEITDERRHRVRTIRPASTPDSTWRVAMP